MSKSIPQVTVNVHMKLTDAAYEKRGAEKVQGMKADYSKNRQHALYVARSVDKRAKGTALEGARFTLTATPDALDAVRSLSFLTVTRAP